MKTNRPFPRYLSNIVVVAASFASTVALANDANVIPPTSGSVDLNPAGSAVDPAPAVVPQTNTAGFPIPTPVGHEIVDQVDDLREEILDLVQKIGDKSADLGVPEWNTSSAPYQELVRNLAKVESSLAANTEMTDTFWSTSVNGQLQSLSASLSKVRDVMQQPKVIDVLGNSIVERVNDVRTETRDLVQLILDRGSRFSFSDWGARKGKFEELLTRVKGLDGKLTRGNNAVFDDVSKGNLTSSIGDLSDIINQVSENLKISM
jgi:hypothetical protein